MTTISLQTILEAALFASGEPISIDRLQSLFDQETEKPSKTEIKNTLSELMLAYENRPILLKEVASGYCFQVKTEFSGWVQKLWDEKPSRHSRALIETLAIIAYRQPITRAEIEEIRGVSVSTQIVRTLLEHEWVRVVGEREVPGRPSLYGTTTFFLDYFNVKNLSELPDLIALQNLIEEETTEATEQDLEALAEVGIPLVVTEEVMVAEA